MGIAAELYAERNVYFSCVPLIRRWVEAVKRKLKAQERAIVCGAAEEKDCSPGPLLQMTSAVFIMSCSEVAWPPVLLL